MNNHIPIDKLKSVTSTADHCSAMPILLLALVGLMWVAFAVATSQAQTLLSPQTQDDLIQDCVFARGGPREAAEVIFPCCHAQ